MKRLLLLLLFTPILSLAQNDTVHLVWMVGESNIAGMAPNASATAGELATRSNLKIWNNSTNAFESLLIGTNNNINQNVSAGTHGLELYAANAADAGTLKAPVYMVKCGWSGGRIQDFRSGGSQYSVLYSRINAAMSYLNGQGIKYRITIWMSIGINDYNAGVTSADYRTQLMALKSELRGAVGNARVIQTELLTGGGNHPYNADISTVAAADPYGLHQIALTNGVAMLDAAHFSYADFRNIIGPRIVASMPAILNAPSGGSFAFTAIDSLTNFIRPGAGVMKWHSMNSNQKFVVPPGGEVEPMDKYIRSWFYWSQFETSLGVYNWTVFDNEVNDCISKGNGQKLHFNIMDLAPGTDGISIGGGYCKYPAYVHNQMQADGGTGVDQLQTVYGTAIWLPNYNNSYFLTRRGAMLNALAAHIAATSYNGVPYSHVIGNIDVGWAMYGESHWAGTYSNNVDNMPAGFLPTGTNLNTYVNQYKAAFPNFRLLAIMHGFDGNSMSNVKVPPEVGYNLLTSSTNAGRIGWKRMNFGIGFSENYIPLNSINSSIVYNGMRFDTAIANLWKYAPLDVEGPNYDTRSGGPHALWSWPGETYLYHVNTVANGNLSDVNASGNVQDASQIAIQGVKDSAWKAFRKAGARLLPTGGSAPTTITNGTAFTINMQMANWGVAPIYENWTLQYQLQNTSTSAVVWTGNSAYNVKSILPGEVGWSDNVTVSGVSPGTYKLVLKMVDPNGYRLPYPFGINGRQADGSYILLNSVTVGSGGESGGGTPSSGNVFPRKRFAPKS